MKKIKQPDFDLRPLDNFWQHKIDTMNRLLGQTRDARIIELHKQAIALIQRNLNDPFEPPSKKLKK